MALNVRKKRFISRMAGYAANPLQVKYRAFRNQEQKHSIRGIEITLPPDHNLPFYQRRDPTYDAYAIDLLGQLAEGTQRVCVIDVGANVGDTAASVLASSPRTKVISVEGDPTFVRYLRRNLAPYSHRAEVIEGFVGPVGSQVAFTRSGSTGGFRVTGDATNVSVQEWVSPSELLRCTEPNDLLVWKSDIDGFDIHVLVNHWKAINERSDVIWFEYDTPGTLGDRGDDDQLIEALGASGRTLLVYDNLGRRMTQLPPGDTEGLRTLSQWMFQQREGHVVVPYLDVWALTPQAAKLLSLRA